MARSVSATPAGQRTASRRRSTPIPHTDASGKLAVVHNGVIENYSVLKQQLLERGFKLRTETDTEVLAFLIGDHFDRLDAETDNRLEMALMEALKEVTGTYGLVVVHQDQPGIMVGARRGSPLVLGIGAHEPFPGQRRLGHRRSHADRRPPARL